MIKKQIHGNLANELEAFALNQFYPQIAYAIKIVIKDNTWRELYYPLASGFADKLFDQLTGQAFKYE